MLAKIKKTFISFSYLSSVVIAKGLSPFYQAFWQLFFTNSSLVSVSWTFNAHNDTTESYLEEFQEKNWRKRFDTKPFSCGKGSKNFSLFLLTKCGYYKRTMAISSSFLTIVFQEFKSCFCFMNLQCSQWYRILSWRISRKELKKKIRYKNFQLW